MSGSSLAESVKDTVTRALRARGYEVRRIERTPRAQFMVHERQVFARHRAQTVETVQGLKQRYEEPIFGEITVWEVVDMLAHVIDRGDRFLMNVSQEVHTLQVVEGLLDEGNDDETMLLAALIHDTGKALYLTEEDPANISCSNEPIGNYEPGVGLDNVVFHWGHDEFAYSRFKDLVPDHVAWLIRYHSMVPDSCAHLMDDRDREYFERFHKQFSRLDQETKSTYEVPRTRLSDYRPVVENAFPDPIPF